jgi:hypothetical protein
LLGEVADWVGLSPELSAALVGVGERPAILHGGQEREVAQIAEITHVERFDLTPWPDACAMSRRNKALSARLWCLGPLLLDARTLRP